jgi:hypothetical protein
MGSKDRLSKLSGFCQRRGPSPDEGGEHVVKMNHLRPSSGFHSSFSSCLPLPSLPSSCSFHALYSLPPHVFVDPNELTRDHDLRTTVDLEAPVFSVDQHPTHILYNITANTALFHPNGTVCFNLPIHARYGIPSTSRLHHLSIDCPQVFSACPQSRMSTLSSSSRANSVTIIDNSQPVSEEADISEFLHTKGITLHLFQRSTDCAPSLLLPVGDPSVLKDVQLGTALVLLSAAVYCLSAFIGTFRRLTIQRIAYKED